MPYSEKFIRAATKANFQSLLGSGEITNDSIGFIEDTNEIWARGKYYATPEVFISDGVEPTGDSDIWIDTSENSEFISIEDAPSDGNIYGRQDGQWVKIEDEVWIGTDEPDGNQVIWIDPESGEIKFKNPDSDQWEEAAGGGSIGEITETLKVNLTSNQTNPNVDLNGVTVSVTFEGDSGGNSQVWQGQELSFTIPMGVQYTVSASSVTDYAIPSTETFTAIAGNTRNHTFTYNTTVVSVIVSGVTSCTATVTGSSTNSLTFSEGALTQTFRVPTGQQYTVTFSEVSGYATPAQISTTASGANASHTANYSNTTVTVNVGSNQSDFNENVQVSIEYMGDSLPVNGQQQIQGTGQVQFSVPYGVAYTISFNEISPFRTPTQISDNANASTKEHSVSYDATDVTINLTSNHGTTDLGNARATIGGTQYSNGQTVRVATGSTVSTTFTSVTGYSTPAAQSPTATGTEMTITGTYQSEWVTINVTGVSSGFTISITGGFTATQTATSQTHKIPYGTSYTVVAGAVNGYTAPSNQPFTANSNTRTVTVAYTEIVNGVFVYDNTGGLTPIGSWNTGNNSSAVGIALITDNTRLVIKKGLSAVNNIQWAENLYGTDVSGIFTTSSESQVPTDYAGQNNTDLMISSDSSGNTFNNSAKYCQAQTITVNGRTVNGYLPSGGELADMYNNKSVIENALATIGSQTIRSLNTNSSYTPYLWSSTESSSDGAWLLLWGYSSLDFSANAKGSSTSYGCALPVFPLD